MTTKHAWNSRKPASRPERRRAVAFVGSMPSRNGDPEDPLGMGPGSGARLASLMGLDQATFCRRYPRFNLNRYYQIEDELETVEARRNVSAILWVGLEHGDVAVLLGRQVCRAFGIDEAVTQRGWLSWHERGGRHLLAMPHPSGRNRWWNDQENVSRASAVLRELCRGVTREEPHDTVANIDAETLAGI